MGCVDSWIVIPPIMPNLILRKVYALSNQTNYIFVVSNCNARVSVMNDSAYNLITVPRIISNTYIASLDTANHALRLCNVTTGKVTTIAGNGKQGKDYTGGNQGKEQPLASPWDICVGLSPGKIDNPTDNPDVLYVAMAGTHQIWGLMLQDSLWWKGLERKAGKCYAIAGSGAEENRNTSYPLKAGFAQPSGIAYDFSGNILYIADSESSSIRKLCIKEGGAVSKVVGGGR